MPTVEEDVGHRVEEEKEDDLHPEEDWNASEEGEESTCRASVRSSVSTADPRGRR